MSLKMISPSDFCIKNLRLQKKGGGKHSYHFLVYLLSDIKMLEYKYLKDTLLFLLLTHPCV